MFLAGLAIAAAGGLAWAAGAVLQQLGAPGSGLRIAGSVVSTAGQFGVGIGVGMMALGGLFTLAPTAVTALSLGPALVGGYATGQSLYRGLTGSDVDVWGRPTGRALTAEEQAEALTAGTLGAGLTLFGTFRVFGPRFARAWAWVRSAAGRLHRAAVASKTGGRIAEEILRIRARFNGSMYPSGGAFHYPQFRAAGKAGSVGYLTVEEFELLPASGKISPWRLRTSQDTASWMFKPPYNKVSIGDVAYELREGLIAPEEFGAVRIGQHQGLVWSFDNRRIIAFRSAGMDVPYVKLHVIPSKLLRHLSSVTQGESIVIVMPQSP